MTTVKSKEPKPGNYIDTFVKGIFGRVARGNAEAGKNLILAILHKRRRVQRWTSVRRNDNGVGYGPRLIKPKTPEQPIGQKADDDQTQSEEGIRNLPHHTVFFSENRPF